MCPVNLLIAVVIGLAVLVLLMSPGPGAQFRHWLQYRMHKHHLDRGQAVLVIRVASGAHPGLSAHWYRGTAVATPHRLDFTRHAAGLVKRPTVPVEVVGIDDERAPRVMERLLIDPSVRITRLRTPNAVLEVAILPPIPAEAVFARLR